MEYKESTSGMLDAMVQPAFTVRNGVIYEINAGAKAYFLESGGNFRDLLATGQTEYEELTAGCLYVTLAIAGVSCGASVRRMADFDLVTLEQEADQAELQAMALAAQELRMPLSNVMTVADRLFPMTDASEDPDVKEQTAKINRGLFQMLRIISNMSDAYRYSQQTETKMSIVNVIELMDEVFTKAAQLLNYGDTQMHFQNLSQAIFSLADQEKLERAILNIISNAVKFAPKGSRIDARLSRREDMLYLTIQDNGNGISGEMRGTVHTRFQRQPGLEDSRFGIGLGMVLIRVAASIHGGTVLLDNPEGIGTRITMTMRIRQNTDSTLRNPMLTVDYAGERDHSLIELSDVLPFSLYESGNIN